MSLMNLQKLRQIIDISNDSAGPTLTITLPPDDPANFVKFNSLARLQTKASYYTAQVISMHCMVDNPLRVNYHTKDPIMSFKSEDVKIYNRNLSYSFFPRLKEILMEHGFHENYLPSGGRDMRWEIDKPFQTQYSLSSGFWEQIFYACYTNGREMRAAVEFQAYLNKNGRLPPEEID